MRYSLEFRESVRDYLRQLPLSRTARVKLNTRLIALTAEVPDSFRSDPENRPEPTSRFYHFTYLFRDANRSCTLYVVVDDSSAAYGVMSIVYVDCQIG